MRPVRPKKRFGQHFLKDSRYIRLIVEAAELSSDDVVLEIGPGTGVLTRELAGKAGKVIAVEVDRDLAALLQKHFAAFPNVEVICADILAINLTELLGFVIKGGRKGKVVANLPYYITTPVISMLLDHRELFERLVVMVQREVADRMIARPHTKDYGAFSVKIQFHSEAQVVTRVPRGAFDPAPKVDSAVVCLRLRERPAVSVINEELFFKIVRAGFGKRRKMLRNALLGSDLGFDPDLLDEAFRRTGILPSRRAESLSLGEFALLADVLAGLSMV
ncbi:MAG TPA: 16S rRNA (adenine(1518)-N(6)/adenine(1519)-N(6))-dimethyltransferase RsmA [Firmicutes bacterium]|nr:16S rRNA (adenine(1518)-N(6)/adenine(1519)-N(6))-dimethyltransferase RsmA [Bacillota bacterium]HHY98280.1 16S rRNA (adenine(1518)-N(6)/adenine(1519)-N(6))-dimethyltransferase RsmA [Bacillota bacterium]